MILIKLVQHVNLLVHTKLNLRILILSKVSQICQCLLKQQLLNIQELPQLNSIIMTQYQALKFLEFKILFLSQQRMQIWLYLSHLLLILLDKIQHILFNINLLLLYQLIVLFKFKYNHGELLNNQILIQII